MARNPEGQVCENCRFFRPEDVALERTSGGPVMQPGWCFRYPPSPARGGPAESEFPRVYGPGWCGEWMPADPQTPDEGAATLARLVLLGDMTAARALADKLRERET
jgi:hypothetical protein